MPHLGLGDHIICNAIVRNLRKSYDVVHMPVKAHNFHTVKDMLRDDPGIELIKVTGDEQALKYLGLFRARVDNIVGVGQYGTDFLNDSKSFDESFYKQIDISYDARWDEFKYVREDTVEAKLFEDAQLPEKYVFVHDDASRNYLIDESNFPADMTVYRPVHTFGELCETTLFHYGKIIEEATEIHCIDSSFACYVEHLDCSRVERLVLHRHIKQKNEFNTDDKFHPFFPQYRQKWEII
jgi:hypothetical protein